MQSGITVVVVTNGERASLFERAIPSILNQECSAPVRVLVVVDRNPLLVFKINVAGNSRVRAVIGDLSPVPASSKQAHLGSLRNQAIDVLKGKSGAELIAYLDDDNEMLPGHLESLLSEIREGHLAAHSWRRVVDQEGHLYDGEMWLEDVAFNRETGTAYDDVNTKVDTNSLLMLADIFDNPSARWGTEFTAEEIRRHVTEDHKLVESLIANKIPIG
jgi:glycosyltransferase involved in cell wall biosynthesis